MSGMIPPERRLLATVVFAWSLAQIATLVAVLYGASAGQAGTIGLFVAFLAAATRIGGLTR